MKKALLLHGATEIGVPEFSSDLLWRTKFLAPDPVTMIEIAGKTFLFASSLEYDRARRQAAVASVILINDYRRKLPPGRRGYADILLAFLKEKNVRLVRVPENTNYALVSRLGKRTRIEVVPGPVYARRAQKTKSEIAEIVRAQKATETAIKKARQLLKDSVIKGDRIYYGRSVLTSEKLRKVIDDTLYSLGYLAVNTIVAGGRQAADPHNTGSGPIAPRVPIVLDVFPLSLRSHYYADCTRTLFKGRPSDPYIKMYNTVSKAQDIGIKMVKKGVDGGMIHKTVQDFFKKEEYPTIVTKEGAEGFIHGLGHGVGLNIHEFPSLGGARCRLPGNSVVTIEPGLYYRRARGGLSAGGIRIEDMVLVTDGGHRLLTTLPKSLNWAIV